ncbi:MAG: efflux system, outer rane lipoprotein NodT family [Betaproteobacteria bacterium]|nr:efflux system, outer rane lipoprotein NodT family [Betaproteobacteria bacterium]
MSRTTWALLLSIAVSLAGCVSYSGIHGESQALAPGSLAFDPKPGADGVLVPGDWPRADWWTMFGDAKLDALMRQALAGNPSLRAAEARVRSARAAADAAGASLYPTLDLNASANRERFSANDIYPPPFGGSWVNQGRTTLDFSYEFDFWGKHRNELRAAIGDARAAAADAAQAHLVLAAAVAQSYFQLQSDLASLAVAQDTLAEREGLRELNRVRTSRGLEVAIAVRQSDQQVASASVEVSAAEAAVQVDRHQLAALLGQGPDAALDIQPALHTYDQALELPANLPADLLARRPDIAAQRFRLEAAAAQIGAAKADFFPNVDLTAFIGFGATAVTGLNLLTASSRIAGVGPALHLPIFDAGRLRANLRGRYGGYDAAVEQYNQTLLDALRQVADQIAGVRAVNQQLAHQAVALAAAEDAHRLTLDRYRAGLTSYLDVLVNEERLLAERVNRVRLQGRSLALAVDMIRALGGGYRVPDAAAERM